MATYSETRWWSRWEVLKQVMLYFGDIQPFLVENDVAPSYRRKLLAILEDPEKRSLLQVELAVVIDVGEQFVKATYRLEGDGPWGFSCFEILSAVDASIRNAHMPNTQTVIGRLTGMPISTQIGQQWLLYARSCVEPGLNYFQMKFHGELSGSVAAFKAARFFLPHKIDEMKPDSSAIDTLKAFPFLDNVTVLNGLKEELPLYLAKAADVSNSIETLSWWKKNSEDLPCWSGAVCKVALVQPSSAAAERVFSLLNKSFDAQQDLALQDYVECSLMLQYNKR